MTDGADGLTDVCDRGELEERLGKTLDEDFKIGSCSHQHRRQHRTIAT